MAGQEVHPLPGAEAVLLLDLQHQALRVHVAVGQRQDLVGLAGADAEDHVLHQALADHLHAVDAEVAERELRVLRARQPQPERDALGRELVRWRRRQVAEAVEHRVVDGEVVEERGVARDAQPRHTGAAAAVGAVVGDLERQPQELARLVAREQLPGELARAEIADALARALVRGGQREVQRDAGDRLAHGFAALGERARHGEGEIVAAVRGQGVGQRQRLAIRLEPPRPERSRLLSRREAVLLGEGGQVQAHVGKALRVHRLLRERHQRQRRGAHFAQGGEPLARTADRAPGGDDRREVHGVLARVDAHDPARRAGRTHRDLQEIEEHPTLALGDEIGPVEDGLGQPGEQVDEAVNGIAGRDPGQLRQMGAQPATGFADEVIEAAVVQVGYR